MQGLKEKVSCMKNQEEKNRYYWRFVEHWNDWKTSSFLPKYQCVLIVYSSAIVGKMQHPHIYLCVYSSYIISREIFSVLVGKTTTNDKEKKKMHEMAIFTVVLLLFDGGEKWGKIEYIEDYLTSLIPFFSCFVDVTSVTVSDGNVKLSLVVFGENLAIESLL